jgi:very-short-patch-repair endonuclease
MTEAEKRLWRCLRSKQLGGYKFRRQHPVGDYVVDFVCLEAKLVVEIDGGQHAEQQHYDVLRSERLVQKGFQVVRFWNNEVMTNIEAVKAAIWVALHHETQPPSQPSPSQGEGVKANGSE